ncbi:hypothetical protein D3C87_1131790 [compost metagenome]
MQQLHDGCGRGFDALGKSAVLAEGKARTKLGPDLANRLQRRGQAQQIAFFTDAIGEKLPEDLIRILKLLEPDPFFVLARRGCVSLVEGFFDATCEHTCIVCCHGPLLGNIRRPPWESG